MKIFNIKLSMEINTFSLKYCTSSESSLQLSFPTFKRTKSQFRRFNLMDNYFYETVHSLAPCLTPLASSKADTLQVFSKCLTEWIK